MFVEADPHANAKFWLDVLDEVIKVLALVVGALWTAVNFVRGRTFKRKLELTTSGKTFHKNGELYVSIVCHLKNVGNSKYPIEQKGTACQIYIHDGTGFQVYRTYPIFAQHDWIEPGEQIDDPLLQKLPNDESRLIAIRIRLRVVCGNIVWNSSCIVEVPDREAERGQLAQAMDGASRAEAVK